MPPSLRDGAGNQRRGETMSSNRRSEYKRFTSPKAHIKSFLAEYESGSLKGTNLFKSLT